MAIDTKTEAAVRLMLDKQEIHEVMMRYCRAIDRMDEELLRQRLPSRRHRQPRAIQRSGGGLHPVVHETTRPSLHRNPARGRQRTD